MQKEIQIYLDSIQAADVNEVYIHLYVYSLIENLIIHRKAFIKILPLIVKIQ